MFGSFPIIDSQVELPDYLTKEEYLDGLGAVFAEASAADDALVIHGRGALALAPSRQTRVPRLRRHEPERTRRESAIGREDTRADGAARG